MANVRLTVAYWTTEKLQAEFDRLDNVDDTLTDTEESLMSAIEAELDAREDWNSDDDRIREAVGNYRGE